MFDGIANFIGKEDILILEYVEKSTNAKVVVHASDEHMTIKREGDAITNLSFHAKQKTSGSVLSEFGTVEIEIFTHKYIKRENIIAIEYDILAGGEVTDGFRIIWTIKEDIV